MAVTTTPPKAAFVTVEQCIKTAMLLTGETNMAMYERYMAFAVLGCNELTFDVIKNLKYTFLPVDSATQTVKLPDDFVNYVRIGLIDQGNEIMDLTYDPQLAPIITNPDENCHCSCGCSNPVCSAIQSNVTYETEDVVINGVTYQKYTTICTEDDGNIVKQVCQPVVTNPVMVCTYQYIIANSNFPQENATLIRNGVSVAVNNISDEDALNSFFSSLGFIVTPGFPDVIYEINDSVQYGQYTYTYNDVVVMINPSIGHCTNTVPVVETVCFTERLCQTTVAPCGCVDINDTVISTFNGLGNFWVSLIQRWIQQLDYVQVFKQPLSYFGYYNVNLYQGLIQLNTNYQYDTIYLEYYSANEVSSKDYLIPSQAEMALAYYIRWQYKMSKLNVGIGEKLMFEKEYYNEKRKLRSRLNPVRLSEVMDILRSVPPVRP